MLFARSFRRSPLEMALNRRLGAGGHNAAAAVQRPEGWLNAAAYSMPLAGTFGNLSRNTLSGQDFQ